MNVDELNRYILSLVKSGSIDKDKAIHLIKRLNTRVNEKQDDIAIIGMSCKYPGSDNLEEFWENLRKGQVSIKECSDQRVEDILEAFPHLLESRKEKKKFGLLEEIDKFDESIFRLSHKEACLMDPYQRLMLQSAYEALEDAGYSGKSIANTKTGVFIGRDNSTKSLYSMELQDEDFLAVTGAYPGILSSRISYLLNLHGPSIVVDTACSSSLVALHMASNEIKNKGCNMAIVGGINLFVNSFPIDGNGSNMDSIESNTGELRAFDKYANGTVWAEGVGTIIIKSLKDAINDKDNIYGVIKGSAINNNGTSNGITAPSADAHEEVILEAWKSAEVNPETIDYIEAHATGTKLGDPIEIKGLTRAFKKYTKKKQFCAIGSLKSNIGHSMSASGVAGIIKILLSMKNEIIPPNINFEEPNPFIDFCNSPIYVNDKEIKWQKGEKIRRAAVSNFGLSGTNCHIIIDEYKKSSVEQSEDNINKSYFITMSAASKDSLSELINNYIRYIERNNNINLSDLCYTANIGRGQYKYRMAVIFKDLEDLKEKLLCISASEYTELKNIDIMYGNYRVVSSKSTELDSETITEYEKSTITKQINSYVKEYCESNKKNFHLVYKICELYVKGADADWTELYKDKSNFRISIPVYPFERRRCWVSNNQKNGNRNERKDSIKAERQLELRGKKSRDYTKMEEYVAEIIAEEVGINEINIYDSLYDLGIDSIHSMQIVNKLGVNLSISIKIEEMEKIESIAELAEYLAIKETKQNDDVLSVMENREEKRSNKKQEFIKKKLEGYKEPRVVIIDENGKYIEETIKQDKVSSNCYILIKSGKGIIVDPSIDREDLLRIISKIDIKVEYVLLTHAHEDHINSIEYVVNDLGAKVVLHEKGIVTLEKLGSISREDMIKYPELKKEFDLSGISFKVVDFKGHTEDSVCIISDKNIFTGDSLFKNSIGNPDTSIGFSYDDIINNIRDGLFHLDDNYIIYPGHGELTTIGDEKRNNPFLKK
ncbi:beta-ketoacyl synthase N-terminal-like domain-containing protein [Clostridium sp. LP20]|uniref:beta-ketoacyl synthase N-terminal-like domain-containing protein n=1 Tax=Clostridium sp. LP20 TaxID=3418665 RepID=UPI003EE4CFA4